MTLEREIRDKLTDYVTEQITLEALQDWLAPLLWDIEEANEPAASKLAYSVELLISEYSAGHLRKAEFARKMDALVLYDASRHTTEPVPPEFVSNECAVEYSSSTHVQ